MLDRSLAFRLKTRTVGCLRGGIAHRLKLVHGERERPSSFACALFLSNTSKDVRIYEVRPRKDRRSVDLISDALPFGRLWYGEPNAISNAFGYAKFYSRSTKTLSAYRRRADYKYCQ
jgi:hypothetical protein